MINLLYITSYNFGYCNLHFVIEVTLYKFYLQQVKFILWKKQLLQLYVYEGLICSTSNKRNNNIK